MKRFSYSERDYAFGQAMQTLRMSIGLTQTGLADLLGISRRAVGEWETGGSYPKPHHLKHLITLAMRASAFPSGHEEEEIRALWKAAHQKVLLDESWLSSLLHQPSPLPVQVDESGRLEEGNRKSAAPIDWAQTSPPGQHPPSIEPLGSRAFAGNETRVDWGDALDVSHFYGRERELNIITQWVVWERCRVVSVLGMGGIGKSALVTSAMRHVSEHFQVVLFRSLRDAPSCEILLEEYLQRLAPQALKMEAADLQQLLERLLVLLREQRVLLVLDNLECLLEEGEARGHLRPGYDGYARFLQVVAERAHQSCLLLTSREKPGTLSVLEGRLSSVRSLRLGGLEATACDQLLTNHDLVGTPEERARLIERYGGNPLALNVVTETIADLFGGKIAPFLTQDTLVFGSISDLLDEQVSRLSTLEQTVLYWLATLREPVTIEKLRALLVRKYSAVQMLEALDGLHRRSLVERGQRPGSFTLQSVVLEYMTDRLVSTASQEIVQGQLRLLREHGLCQAQAREYVCQTQERLLLAPLLAQLQSADVGFLNVGQRLRSLLDQVRTWNEDAQGYGPANLVTLLRVFRGNLRGLDLSQLVLRSVSLRGVEMQNANLREARIRDTVFTEALDAVWSVAISRNGQYWAAGSLQGKMRVWEDGGQTLRVAWQAHTDVVLSLVFSTDGSTLTSSCMDGTIKQWDLKSGALIWSRRQNSAQNLAASPDGSLLASGGQDATLLLWDAQSGTILQTVAHPLHMVGIGWSPNGQLVATGCIDGQFLLWRVQKTEPVTCVGAISGHTTWVTHIAFSPDERMLATASWDGTVKLWDVENLRLLQTLTGHTGRPFYLAWSPDGRTIASGGFDKTIWLWDVEHGRYRAALHGHTADVYRLAFTPDSSYLLSGSADGTVRVWDVASGQCANTIHGYSVSHHDISWSPDGKLLASGDTNAQVTIWNVDDEAPPRVLQGHSWTIGGVTWSPDGRWLASSSWDDTIRLWDATSWTCIETLRDPNAVLRGIAWSPDGHRLAWGTYNQGVHVWDMIARRRLEWNGQAQQTEFRRVAWSLDDALIVSAGTNGIIYVWNSEDGTLLRQLLGHNGMVASVAWSPDGTRLLSGGGRDSGELFIWDIQRGEPVQTFAGSPDVIYAVGWSPIDDIVVSGDSNGVLRWWNIHSGQCMHQREAHEGTILSLKISPDGRRLASCGGDSAIKIWDLQSTGLLRTLRRDRPYERVDITGIQGLTDAQKSTLLALGARENRHDL